MQYCSKLSCLCVSPACVLVLHELPVAASEGCLSFIACTCFGHLAMHAWLCQGELRSGSSKHMTLVLLLLLCRHVHVWSWRVLLQLRQCWRHHTDQH
jgi:hypothetical protein